MNKIRSIYYSCLGCIRPQAVSIVDSFEIDDRELLSVLGRRDGNVYEKLLEWSKSSPLNQTPVCLNFYHYLKKKLFLNAIISWL